MQDADDDEIKPVFHHVRVGLSGGSVHNFELPSDAILEAVVEKVLEKEHLDPVTTRIRLIIAGKLCTDLTLLVRDIVPDGGFIHCAVTNVNSANSASLQTNPAAPALPDASDVSVDTYNVDGEVRIVIPDLNSGSAFERFARAGFTPDEIQLIRRHVRAFRREAGNRLRNDFVFEMAAHPDDSASANPTPDGDRNERTNVTIRTRPQNNFIWGSSVEGTNRDFLMGCIFGYLLGIMILVLLMTSHASKRWRVGIIAGVATNCAFGILRTSLYFQNFTTT